MGWMMIQVMKKWQRTSLLVTPPLMQASFILVFWDTATRRKVKAREAFTVPFSFLCDYDDQYEEHMKLIVKKLEIPKADIASFHEKSQELPEHSQGEKLSGVASCSVPLEKSRTWTRGETHKHG
jgi:hypothetical protein